MLYLSKYYVFFLSVVCCSFWTGLGACMTKLNPDETKIHIIGNNVTGNKKGESMLTFLSKAMRPSKVKVESPLELGQAGQWLWRWLHDSSIEDGCQRNPKIHYLNCKTWLLLMTMSYTTYKLCTEEQVSTSKMFQLAVKIQNCQKSDK